MRDIPPIHPGEHLAEFLNEHGLSQYALAKATSMSEIRIVPRSCAVSAPSPPTQR